MAKPEESGCTICGQREDVADYDLVILFWVDIDGKTEERRRSAGVWRLCPSCAWRNEIDRPLERRGEA